METPSAGSKPQLDRRQFLAKAARYSILGLALPSVLEACTRTGPGQKKAVTGFSLSDYKSKTKSIQDEAEAMIGDLIDFELTSDEWEGVFGFAKFRLHKGAFEGNDVFFIRTDASDESFATAEKLVFVPKLAPLTGDGLAGQIYLFDSSADQAAVFSSEPGRDAYTPAWRVNKVAWKGSPRKLGSVSEVTQAQSKGELTIDQTGVILNAAMVKWSSGELAVDGELKSYLGKGQLIEAPDTSGMTVTFKLQECFPQTRYIVTDHSIAMAAEMTKTSLAPGLQGGPTKAGTTGRTNVFMNGLKGPGPMGFQPSAFDFAVGESAWSPYWDHWTYAWKEGKSARLLKSQTDIHRARDAGDLDEFPGTPDTKGDVFTVNCPAPVKAPNVFTA